MNIDITELLSPEEVQLRIKQYLEDHPELIATAIKKAVDQQIRTSVGQAFDTWQNKTAKENLALIDAAVKAAFKTALEEIKPDMTPIKNAINKQIKQILKNISLEIVSHR